MKFKILALVTVLFLFTSCDEVYDAYDKEQVLEKTNLKLITNIDTTYGVSFSDEYVYLFKQDTVVYKALLTSNTDYIEITFGVLIFTVLVWFFIGIMRGITSVN